MYAIQLDVPHFGILYWKDEAATFVEAHQFSTLFGTPADAQHALESAILPDLAEEYAERVAIVVHPYWREMLELTSLQRALLDLEQEDTP